jgi:hypothetical protein
MKSCCPDAPFAHGCDETPLPAGQQTTWFAWREPRPKWVSKIAVPVACPCALCWLPIPGRSISDYGKPANRQEAEATLAMLAGRTHEVLTAVALAWDDRLETRLSASKVTFAPLNASQIRNYVASGEPHDKAGGYAIQGRAAAFVTRLEGSYSGVMGLPLAETVQLLLEFGLENIL